MSNSEKMKNTIIISSAPKKPIKQKAINQLKINWNHMNKHSNISCSKGSNSETIIIDDSIYGRFHDLLNDCSPEFEKIWEEKGLRSLLELRINSENETIIHYACQKDNVELAKILLNYRLFLKYGKMSKETLEKEEFRKFVYSETSSGENAFYQCLKRLGNKNDALIDILRLFIKSDLLLNTNIYINKRAGYKTTILHLLIENEQLELLKYFIDIYEFGDDEYDPIDFMKKDFLDRTPLMVALDTGNKIISELIYKKAKSKMKDEELTRADEYINEFDCDDANMLKKIILQNKLIIVSSKDEIKKLDIMKNQYIREIDGQSFESIWLEYLLLANKFNIVIAERDSESFSDDMKKQIFINRVNKTISERHTLVTIVIVNYSKFYQQLSDFLRFLPYNFKIILVSTNEPVLKLNFSIKQQAFKYQQQTSAGILSALTDNSTFDFEKLIHQDIKHLNQYIRDDVGIEEAIKLFKQVLKFEQLPDSLKHLEYKFFDKLGDLWAFLYNNFNKSLVYYEKAYEVRPEEETFELANLLIKLGESYLKCDNKSQAFDYFLIATEICKKLKPVRNDILGKCYESIAKYYKHEKNSEKEIDYLKKAIESYTGDDLKVARMKNLIFCAYSNQGLESEKNLKEALKYLNESNECYLNSSPDNQAFGKYNLGIAYSKFDDEKDKKKSICYYQESIDKNTEFYKENSNIHIANALNNIGLVYKGFGDHKNAIQHYKRALEMFEIIYKRDHADLAMILNNIGTCYDVIECRKQGLALINLIRLEYLTAANEMLKRINDKKDSGLKADNKEIQDSASSKTQTASASKNEKEDEIYLFIPDIKTNGERKIEMFFANLLGVEHIKMLFLELEKKAAIALSSVPFSKIDEYRTSLRDIELRYIPKTKDVLIKVNTKDLDEAKLLINQILSPEKFSASDRTSNETIRISLVRTDKPSSDLYRRPIIIDGNNVGMSHGRSKVFSCRGLQIAVDYFTKLGHLDIKVVVPRKRLSSKDLDVPNMNPEILIDLEKKGLLVYVSNKVYDDETILELAIRKNAVVISNDQYRDLKGASPRFANYLKSNNTLEYVLSGDIFFINQKPFGQYGPTLDEVLTMHSKQDDNYESRIVPISDAERPKKDSGFKAYNKEKKDSAPWRTAADNQNEVEIYLFIPDIKTNGERKIEMFFANLLGVEHIKMLFLELEKKAAIALSSVPFSSVSRYDLIKTNVGKRSSLVKRGDLLLNYDGSIESRSKAVRSGNVQLNADKTIDRTASSAVQTGAVRFKQSPVQTTQTGYTKSIAYRPPMFLSVLRNVEDANITALSSSNKNQSTINYDYTHRFKDGSRDMRYKGNWGQGKFGSQITPSSYHIDYDQAQASYDYDANASSLNATNTDSAYSYCPPTPPSYHDNKDDAYHRCNDGSREMRYKKNWGHSKYGGEDLSRQRSPSPYKPPSSDDDDHYVNATHTNSAYSYCPPTPPSPPSYDDKDDDDCNF